MAALTKHRIGFRFCLGALLALGCGDASGDAGSTAAGSMTDGGSGSGSGGAGSENGAGGGSGAAGDSSSGGAAGSGGTPTGGAAGAAGSGGMAAGGTAGTAGSAGSGGGATSACGPKTWASASDECWSCLCDTCPDHLDACSDGSCWETIACGVANSCFGTDVITETGCLLANCEIGEPVIALDGECLIPEAPESTDGTVRRACDLVCGVHSEAAP